MKLSWGVLTAIGSVLTLVSISGFFLTYSFLEKNKMAFEIGRSILFPGPYDLNFLSSPELRTIAYFFVAIVILLVGLFITGLLGVILLLMGVRKKILSGRQVFIEG
jgi:hypothetical protein